MKLIMLLAAVVPSALASASLLDSASPASQRLATACGKTVAKALRRQLFAKSEEYITSIPGNCLPALLEYCESAQMDYLDVGEARISVSVDTSTDRFIESLNAGAKNCQMKTEIVENSLALNTLHLGRLRKLVQNTHVERMVIQFENVESGSPRSPTNAGALSWVFGGASQKVAVEDVVQLVQQARHLEQFACSGKDMALFETALMTNPQLRKLKVLGTNSDGKNWVNVLDRIVSRNPRITGLDVHFSSEIEAVIAKHRISELSLRIRGDAREFELISAMVSSKSGRSLKRLSLFSASFGNTGDFLSAIAKLSKLEEFSLNARGTTFNEVEEVLKLPQRIRIKELQIGLLWTPLGMSDEEAFSKLENLLHKRQNPATLFHVAEWRQYQSFWDVHD